jgi:hypothetical protein
MQCPEQVPRSGPVPAIFVTGAAASWCMVPANRAQAMSINLQSIAAVATASSTRHTLTGEKNRRSYNDVSH